MPLPGVFSSTPAARLVGAGAAAGLAGLGYAWLEARNFTVRQVRVPVLPVGSDPVRVLHLSDLHLTPYQGRKRDWIASLAVVQGLIAVGVVGGDPNNLGTLALFVLESSLFTATMGGSFGKLATRLRVVRYDDPARPVTLLRALLRTVLVALVIPPLLTFDGRGLHDLAAGTRTVTL